MLVKDVMTRNVNTVSSSTSVWEAQRILKEGGLRRLPVVDNGRLVGVVTENRLERVKPRTATPLFWQIMYLRSHTNVGAVMRKKVVTIKPTDTIEQAITKAQSAKVGALVVVDKGKVVGIATTNNFFYNVVNPTLGIGEGGTRIIVAGGGQGQAVAEITSGINRLGVAIKVLWAVRSPATKEQDLTIHLETEDASGVISELEKLGYKAEVVAR